MTPNDKDWEYLVNRMYRRTRPRRARKVAVALVAALAVLTFLALGVVGAPEAQASTGCVWTMADSAGNGYAKPAGTQECESWSSVKRIGESSPVGTPCANGYRVVLRGPWAYYCNMDDWAYLTKEPPVTGGEPGTKSRAIADSMRALGDKHGVTVQLARVDQAASRAERYRARRTPSRPQFTQQRQCHGVFSG